MRTSRYEGTGSNPSDLQQQSRCGWSSFVRLDHFVTARIARFTFSASCSRSYELSNPEHVKRNRKSYLDPIGDRWVPDCFETMLPRVRRKLSSSLSQLHMWYRAIRFWRTMKSGSGCNLDLKKHRSATPSNRLSSIPVGKVPPAGRTWRKAGRFG